MLNIENSRLPGMNRITPRSRFNTFSDDSEVGMEIVTINGMAVRSQDMTFCGRLLHECGTTIVLDVLP